MRKLNLLFVYVFFCLLIFSGCQKGKQEVNINLSDKYFNESEQKDVKSIVEKNIKDSEQNENNLTLDKKNNESNKEGSNLISDNNSNKQDKENIIDNEFNEDKNNDSTVLVSEDISQDESTIIDEDSKIKNNKAEEVIDDKIDIDLTQLSSAMVYAEVYNMVVYPDKYLGKTVKMKGIYYSSYYEETDMYYHYVVIEDATACCKQGMEFKLGEEYIYPEDYPEELAEIEVIGVFNVYEELGYTFYYFDASEVNEL